MNVGAIGTQLAGLVSAAAVLFALSGRPLPAAEGAASPFLPPGFGVKPEATAPPSVLDKIEFRGVLTLDGTTYVTLFDAAKSKSYTVELGETVETMKVTDYRVSNETDTVLVTMGSESRRIELRKPKIVAIAAQPTPPAVPVPQVPQVPGVPMVQPVPPTPGITQMSDEEVRQRMQRVAEEIRRRRAMRRDMLEENQQPGP